jgi:ectoine hydroxylase-related dioxygenase (phytanoyl-CoA dioxygenase family)
MKIADILKRYKPVHWIYNLLHREQLSHNKKAYKTFRINKPIFQSVSSRDFPDKTSSAWLDTGPSSMLLQNKDLGAFPPDVQSGLKHWSEQGYLIWKNLLDDLQVEAVNREVDKIIASGEVSFTHDNKLSFLNKRSLVIEQVSKDPRIIELLELILGKEVVPFQTLNFLKGSEQRAHSDSIHMTTYPLGYLIAVWIALEDIKENSGPLFYYPGSHKLPYLLNDDFGNTSSAWMLGKKNYTDYEDVIENLINKKQMQPQVFLPKKGDMLVWHANLLHGGAAIKDLTQTRKSMVIHYYAKDVIKYHEITERPSLMR